MEPSGNIPKVCERAKRPAVGWLLILLLAISVSADQTITVRGEIADTYCLGARGVRGPSHTACAIRCARKGVPLALVEDGTRRLYILLPPKDETAMPENVIRAAGTIHTVTGRMFVNSGTRFLTVDTIK
jgi:hypothetical protein